MQLCTQFEAALKLYGSSLKHVSTKLSSNFLELPPHRNGIEISPTKSLRSSSEPQKENGSPFKRPFAFSDSVGSRTNGVESGGSSKKSKSDPNLFSFKSFPIRHFANIFVYVRGHPRLKQLLSQEEIERLNTFFGMAKEEYMYFVFKLYTRQAKWYNVFKLAEELKMDFATIDIQAMYYVLSEKEFIVTGKH